MKSKSKPWLVVLVTIIAVFSDGCAHKKAADEDAGSFAANEDALGSSDTGQAMGLMTIHFPFDSSLLPDDAKAALAANSEILKIQPSLKIQIEGHCDSQGGIQYNIALGERRANSAKHYMQDLGIPSGRISVVSYGKERLLDPKSSEEAHAKNRRANFVITSK